MSLSRSALTDRGEGFGSIDQMSTVRVEWGSVFLASMLFSPGEGSKMGYEEEPYIAPLTDWNELSLIEKFRDKDISRPPKTWKNRLFWTWPLHILTGETVSRDARRIQRRTLHTSSGEKPSIQIKTTKFRGETYKNRPLSHAFEIAWYSWFWGWK